MDAFCGGGEFWNASQTWGETATWPQFTECFQNTVLVWVAGGWLWIASPFYMAYIASCESNPLHNCWRSFAKLMLTLILLAICIVEFTWEASDRLKQEKSLLEAAFMGPVVEAATLVLVIIYIVLEKRKGFITSGVLFIYWVLALLTYIIPFYTKIITQQYKDELLKVCLFYIYFGLTICQVVLYSFADSPPYAVHKNTCPEMQVSFLSRVTFWWMNRLLLTGYRKPLTEADIFSLNPREQSFTVIPRFERRLQQEKEIVRQHTRNRNILINGDEEKGNDELSESSPLLSTPVSGKSRRKSTKDQRKISLMKVLIRTFGCELLLSHIWKLLYDVLIFVGPNLLRLFIEFIEDRTMMVWKGYVLACAFFCVIVMQSFFFHQLNHQSTSLSLRVRAALISAVFKKSLTISGKARKESTIGEIVNLMSVDAEHIRDVLQYMWAMWSSPLQIIVSLVFLYQTLGPSMFAGFGVMVILIPINGFIMNKVQNLQDQQMTQKDNRIKLLTEILNGIKILKLYAWELSFRDKLQAIRNNELKILKKSGFIWTFMGFSWTVAPFLVGLITFATYIFVEESHRLDAKTAFVAISLFNILRFAINMTPMVIAEIIKAVVSVRRLEKFLNNKDLDDTCVSRDTHGQTIMIENGTFTWDTNLEPCLRNINLSIPAGSLVAVVGQVGSGKSSLISAILGEMEKMKGQVNVKGSLAYVPQQAWIQNATIQDNILLGNTMVASQYEEVLEACALNPDLDILQARDMTEIGEKGINLSGGQKQRVSLARAIYFNSNIYLLDDPLSAVDSNVGKHIFDKVIGGEGLLKNKTRVLVTHGIHWLPKVDMIVVMSGGTISETGSYDELMEHDGAFAQFLRTYLVSADKTDEDPEVQEFKVKTLQRLVSVHSDGSPGSDLEEEFKRIKRASESEGGASDHQTLPHASPMDAESGKNKWVISKDTEIPQPAEKNKLIEEEAVEVGTVKWSVIVAYARAVGIKFTVLIFVLYGCYQGTAVYASIWLSDWTADPQLQNLTILPANSAERRNRNDFFLGIYGGLGCAQAAFVLVFSIILIFRMIHASAHLHMAMLTNILRCPLEFFDTTPIGRIVNRFTQDIDSIDNELPMQFQMWLDALFICLCTVIIISYSTPIFLSVILPIGILYLVAQRFYIPTSRQLKRLESKTRSPIYNNFSESLTGASVIRAFGVQGKFIKESEKRVDKNQQFAFANYSANRWLGFRLEFTGAVVVLAAAVFSVLERDNISGAIVGLSISYALQITENLNWMVRMTSDMETNIVAVERVQEYTKRPTEAPLSTGVYPRFGWPHYGKVEFNSYSTRYREGLDLVLKDITVSVRPGEKVGIVGRTGAGKSSMTLALFRLIEPAGGQIMVDGQDIAVLGLHDVRSKLTILPQEPVLFSGSLRMNLDPLDEHTDSAIWMALEQAHLKSFVQSVPDKLEYECGEGGHNLSVGQRQLICLARSLLRKSKVLVLDEATAAVDMETDDLIQKTIRKEFADCTVLTIAHRLNTVMDYDRILVLDKGEIKEFDSPNSLLSRPDSLFYQMAKDAKLISDVK